MAHIVFLGNFEVPYSSENHHANSLESLGHTVCRLQERFIKDSVILENALNSDFVCLGTYSWMENSWKNWYGYGTRAT